MSKHDTTGANHDYRTVPFTRRAKDFVGYAKLRYVPREPRNRNARLDTTAVKGEPKWDS